MAMKTVFFGRNKQLNFDTEGKSGPPVIHTLNSIVEIKKTLALNEMNQVKKFCCFVPYFQRYPDLKYRTWSFIINLQL